VHSSVCTALSFLVCPMIQYSARKFCAALRKADSLKLVNFRAAAAIAIAFSCLTVLVVIFDRVTDVPYIRNLEIDVAPYSTITGVLGFILSFRTSQSYSRFENGANAVYDIAGGLVSVASSLAAFSYHGSHTKEDVEGFKQTVIRLISLLSAMLLTELEGVDSFTQTNFQILDLRSLDMVRVRHLAKETHKTEVVVQWLKTYVIESVTKGTLSVPPPILARVFQELDQCVGKYHSADKISQVPFPFPYVATMDLIMLIHSAITPIVMVSLLSHSFLPIATVFIIVFFLWSMHLIAGELENPFDGEMNDLDLYDLQCELNEKLKAIGHVRPEHVPTLTVSADRASTVLANTIPGRKRDRRRTMVQTLLHGGSRLSVGRMSRKEKAMEDVVSHRIIGREKSLASSSPDWMERLETGATWHHKSTSSAVGSRSSNFRSDYSLNPETWKSETAEYDTASSATQEEIWHAEYGGSGKLPLGATVSPEPSSLNVESKKLNSFAESLASVGMRQNIHSETPRGVVEPVIQWDGLEGATLTRRETVELALPTGGGWSSCCT